ncbi:MAG: hypothetical protein OXF02_03710 [Simkaniaceae bacterium]|nr:hypothetical protein [Simkaniaceae bacterium]
MLKEVAVAVVATTVCFIACHGGAADHFAVFADHLANKGYTVRVYGAGPASDKFRAHQTANLYVFSPEGVGSEEREAAGIAKACAKVAVVITDVGHRFGVALQKSLADHAPKVLRVAYYDNPEPYVPGGYSATASRVMQEAHKVVFANANLAKSPVYREPSQEVSLPRGNKIGLGYYPLEKARHTAERRESDRTQVRKDFFSHCGIEDVGQKMFVYVGGNNEEYFLRAFPAFLRFMADSSAEHDLSDVMIVLQQHPGARAKNIDAGLVRGWVETHGSNKRAPKVLISHMNTDDALVPADAVFYYQTSMGPWFVLAGIPTVQVGHEKYDDILVKNKLAQVVNSAEDFVNVLQTLQENKPRIASKVVEEGLGVDSDWPGKLDDVVHLLTQSVRNIREGGKRSQGEPLSLS